VFKRKVRINLILVGKTIPDYKPLKELSNQEVFYWVESQVLSQFGKQRPVYVSDEDRLFGPQRYPNFYAAGWFISDDPIKDTEGNGSELVVVTHGESMKAAQTSMMIAVGNSDWDDLAKNI